jgi:hypothetical protein
MTSTRFTAISLAALVFTGADIAMAQQGDDFFRRDRYESVRDRYQEDFDPEPLRLGAFRSNSRLEVGARATDNVFADATAEESDVIARIAPTVDLNSDWSRHELGGRAEIEHLEYADFDTESQTNLRGELRGRIDVTRAFDVAGRVFASDETEQRFSVSSLDIFAEPISFRTAGARLDARLRRDRVRARAFYQVSDRSYDDVQLVDGGSASQEFRDFTFQQVRGRLSYAVTPDLAVFGQAEANMREYDDLTDINGVPTSRDAEGYIFQVGTNFELPRLIRGDIAIGYLDDSTESEVFNDISGTAVDVTFEWFPTRLTTLRVDAVREVTDPGLRAAGSATNGEVDLRVDHELYRNIILFANAGYQEFDFEDIDRSDETTELRLGGTYKLNKRFHLDGFVSRFDRSSTDPVAEFEQNVVGIKLRVFP